MTAPRVTPGGETPPQHIVDFAVDAATSSPCRSKRGAAIFIGDDLVVTGHNFKPREFACDGSAACKATCRNEAIHAEQMALICCSVQRDADMLHVKVVDGMLVPSGGPSCVACSKLILASGIRFMWLYEDSGWRRYLASEFHRLSLISEHRVSR